MGVSASCFVEGNVALERGEYAGFFFVPNGAGANAKNAIAYSITMSVKLFIRLIEPIASLGKTDPGPL